jgi:glycosyltransferase involved in cell wall biosynthesis
MAVLWHDPKYSNRRKLTMYIQGSNQNAPPSLDIVVPCFNEEEVLPETCTVLCQIIADLVAAGQVDETSRVVFVDDGSSDATWELLSTISKNNESIVGVRLARNSGHQNALLAGVEYSKADAILTVDADLQDDVQVIPEMVEKFRSGFDIVYGVRERRSSDTFFKRSTAQIYYKTLRIMGVDIVPDHADFRLLSRAAVNRLLKYSEVNLFLRGIVPLLGDRTCRVYYERRPRLAGETKYPVHRMLGLAIDGVTSFSAVPLRLIAAAGFLIFVLSIGMTAWVLFVKLFTNAAIPGWASSVLPIYFLGGVQLLAIGVVGEYVAKIYLESKQRPRFFVDEILARKKSQGANLDAPS